MKNSPLLFLCIFSSAMLIAIGGVKIHQNGEIKRSISVKIGNNAYLFKDMSYDREKRTIDYVYGDGRKGKIFLSTADNVRIEYGQDFSPSNEFKSK